MLGLTDLGDGRVIDRGAGLYVGSPTGIARRGLLWYVLGFSSWFCRSSR